MSLLRKNLTPEQTSQKESNKLAVETLNVQVTHLLLELQNACVTRSLSWETLKESVIRNVDQSRRTRRGKPGARDVRDVRDVRDLQMLLLQLKEIASL